MILNPVRMSVTIDGKEIFLSAKEYQLMSYMLTRSADAISRHDMFAACWPDKDADVYAFSNIVDVYMNYLRRKIGKTHIVSVRGVGYRLVV